jgi:hypothetical protein
LWPDHADTVVAHGEFDPLLYLQLDKQENQRGNIMRKAILGREVHSLLPRQQWPPIWR